LSLLSTNQQPHNKPPRAEVPRSARIIFGRAKEFGSDHDKRPAC
jgi:hypothetical protein